MFILALSALEMDNHKLFKSTDKIHEQSDELNQLNHPGRNSDEFLTSRILKTSQRKLQLIRELLTPEQYDQVNSRLLSSPHNLQEDKLESSSIINFGNALSNRTDYLLDDLQGGSGKGSKSYTRLEESPVKNEVQANLLKKREAIQFFFQEPASRESKPETLALELKSGHYLNAASDIEEKVLKRCNFSLTDRLIGLLSLLGLNLYSSDQDDHFVNHYQQSSRCPYSRPNNLLAMKKRLESDGQLDKFQRTLLAVKSPSTSEVQLEMINSVQSIETSGHFNKICFYKGQPFNELDGNLICRNLYPTNRRQAFQSSLDDKRPEVKLDMISLRIVEHKLMSAEEKITVKLKVLANKLSLQRKDFQRHTKQYIKDLQQSSSFVNSEAVERFKSNARSLRELRKSVFNDMQMVEQELLDMGEQLNTIRREQGYNSTSVTVIKRRNEAQDYNVLKLLDRLMDESSHINSTSADLMDFYQQTKTEEELLSESREQHDLMESGLELTPINKCPPEEVMRQREVRGWTSTIDLKLMSDSTPSFRCQIEPTNELFTLDLRSNQLKIPMAFQRAVDVKVQISERPMVVRTRQEVTMTVGITAKRIVHHLVDVKFSNQTTEACLEFFSSTSRGNSRLLNRIKDEQEVYSLCKQISRIQTPLENTSSQVCNLLNKVDLKILLGLLGGQASNEYFSIDPFATYLNSDSKNQNSVRHNLLTWRWNNNLNQPIYLSERDNSKILGTQVEERIGVQLPVVEKLSSDYTSIEQIRKAAVEYIRRYEEQLEEKLRFNEEKQSNDSSFKGAINLLVEPRLNVDLSGVARAAVRLVPRRTAKRPLMPNRRATGREMPVTKDIESSMVFDLEKQTFNHWQRFVQQRTSNLQLVVAVQHASNVPMRIMRSQEQQQQQTQRLRPPTPHLNPASPFAPSPVSFISQGSNMNMNLPNNRYLASPTTYVELVFQRNQQATSLAEGKSPAWNETLIFPFNTTQETGRQSPKHIGKADDELVMELNARRPPAHNLLVDECLQLNLYDYRPSGAELIEEYKVSRMPEERQIASSTRPLLSSEIDYGFRTADEPQAQRLVSSRQRIERHLLGSLCIPLTTLLTSGKIQGSFALKQPIFLDDYQFDSRKQDNRSLLTNVNLPLADNKSPRAEEGTNVNLFITLDPPISVPMHLYLATGSMEEERLFEYARQWERLVVSWFSSRMVAGRRTKRAANSARSYSRHIRALVLQRDGKYCLINRLLCPIEPPAELMEIPDDKQGRVAMKQMKTLARFVSLLRPLKYGLFNMRLLASCVWFDSAQLIEQSLGGHEEKAVLLCNYFLHLGYCSALLLGDAIPEGRCVYVIVWAEQSRLSSHNQLQLQATDLLESISAVDSDARSSAIKRAQQITQETFLSRMPIIVGSKSVQLWDANAGKVYSLADQLPLVSIGCIISSENVYANVQVNDRPAETNYDIRLKHFWFPLFEQSLGGGGPLSSRGIKMPLELNERDWRRRMKQVHEMRRSIGRPQLAPLLRGTSVNYCASFSTESCESLRGLIENVVKAHLLKWRPQRPTYFNRTLSRLVSEKLILFEDYRESLSAVANFENSSDWYRELGELIKDQVLAANLASKPFRKQVVSWPFNMTYTSMKAIVDALYASGVYNADLELNSEELPGSGTQFLVASHIHPYPSRVLSVWLYVAAIVTN